MRLSLVTVATDHGAAVPVVIGPQVAAVRAGHFVSGINFVVVLGHTPEHIPACDCEACLLLMPDLCDRDPKNGERAA